ncbi:MAG: PD-(D/E)XK nuclease family protein [Austwickia sp.]|nr:PD-(D/E)XK nuclease family protein [Austwickia sp.]MBK8435964.1 PD-(D/E)XK nuclease family protein [Austwickia sp.]MBK9101647.1 PD-(D/E)XK nuclease family protein [Austwickia sp.]
MPMPLYAASASRLLTWLTCPRQYRLRYLDRPAPPRRSPRAHTTVGLVTHAVLRGFWELPPPHRRPADVVELVRSHWSDQGFRDDEQARRWQRRVTQEVIEYLRAADRTLEPLGLERTVAFRTDTAAFVGRIDRLDDRDGALVVVDYKTGRVPCVEEDARTSLPMALYLMAVRRIWRRPASRVELHHVPTATVAGHDHDDASLDRKLAEAHSLVADVRRADAAYLADGPESARFAPRISALCAWCDVRSHCPPGQAYGPERADWAGLEGEDWG